jgi:hypothetical protein
MTAYSTFIYKKQYTYILSETPITFLWKQLHYEQIELYLALVETDTLGYSMNLCFVDCKFYYVDFPMKRITIATKKSLQVN